MTTKKSTLSLTVRDHHLLWLLDWTPATADLIQKASLANSSDFFPSHDAVRQRLAKLIAHDYIKSYPLTLPTGGRQQHYYALTPKAAALFRNAKGRKGVGGPVPPSRMRHTYDLARVIVHTVSQGSAHGVRLAKYHRENEVTITGAGRTKKPDAIVHLQEEGMTFTHLFEIDEHTESIDSRRENAVAETIRCYYAAAEHERQACGKRFRLVYFTDTDAHTINILSVAAQIINDRKRRFVYATTFDRFLAADDALHYPLLLDHHGTWQSLVDTSFACCDAKPLYQRPKRIEIHQQKGVCNLLPMF